MAELTKKEVLKIIKEYNKSAAFTDRKTTDTPTDALSVVNKKFIDDLVPEFSKITSASYLLSDSAAETTILTATIPGGTLSTDRGIYGRFALNMRCDAGAARTFQFKINYGSGNKTVSEELPASADVRGYIDVYVIPQASESSQKLLIGFMAQEEGAATDLLFASASNYDAGVVTDSVDSTVDQTLSVTAELFTAQGGHLVRCEGGFFKLI